MNGFIKVAAAIPKVKVADCKFNTTQIENMMVQADGQNVEIIVFPELSITGYTCLDLFQQQILLENAEHSLMKLTELSHNLSITTIVGLPLLHKGMLLNCAAVIQGGKVCGLIPKTFIPNYKEFYESRWFTSALHLDNDEVINLFGQQIPLGKNLIFNNGKIKFGIEICEDLWATVPPSSALSLEGAEVIFNLSASNDLVEKYDFVQQLVKLQSAKNIGAYIYAGSGYGESSQDLVFSGIAFITENGFLLKEAERFSLQEQIITSEIDIDNIRHKRFINTTFSAAKRYIANTQTTSKQINLDYTFPSSSNKKLSRHIDPLPFIPKKQSSFWEIIEISTLALIKRIKHTQTKTIIIGISGGLDSTLALLFAVRAFDKINKNRKEIIGVTMPGFGTSDRTYFNAIELMKQLGITIREISIKEACTLHFNDLNIDSEVHDATYENSQARERTQILMDIANQMNGFVLGTGDLSELALGWATYNGDHMSMYSINSSIPKTLVKALVQHIASQEEGNIQKLLFDVVDTPISPELIPTSTEGDIQQKTEAIVGPYELHDFFLYHTLNNGFRPSKVYFLAQHAFSLQQDETQSYSSAEVAHWLKIFYKRFFINQFKRSCLPDGPKVTKCSLSPRGDWKMASDSCMNNWIEECEHLEELSI